MNELPETSRGLRSRNLSVKIIVSNIGQFRNISATSSQGLEAPDSILTFIIWADIANMADIDNNTKNHWPIGILIPRF